MFRTLLISLLALPSAIASSKYVGQYVFDQDSAGKDCAQQAEITDDEEWRLYCINKNQSFHMCSLTCSHSLEFEGTVGLCKTYRCDFYGHTFKDQLGKSLPMTKVQGKVTLFAVVPLWESYAQYFYELLEETRKMYQDDTEALLLPIYVEDFAPVIIQPLEEQRVSILEQILPEQIMAHPFLKFVQTLTHKSGFESFDVYTDRPVIFMISSDGYTVERFVSPTLDKLETSILKYGKVETAKSV